MKPTMSHGRWLSATRPAFPGATMLAVMLDCADGLNDVADADNDRDLLNTDRVAPFTLGNHCIQGCPHCREQMSHFATLRFLPAMLCGLIASYGILLICWQQSILPAALLIVLGALLLGLSARHDIARFWHAPQSLRSAIRLLPAQAHLVGLLILSGLIFERLFRTSP